MLLIKRCIDIVAAVVLLLLLAPILIIVALLIKVKLGSPVIFIQERPGIHGKIFRMYKFRTMLNTKDSSGRLLSDEERLTNFGKFLRKTSIDELPELVNVLKGDMSLVGPRPLLVEYLPLYNKEQSRRHEVRPGITGWAQINGRNAISWEEKFKLDVWYVDHWSLWLDLKILFMTAVKVLIREGVDQEGRVGMEKFVGNDATTHRRNALD
ncbi:sugar transferase [Crassaminicella indica]|uniref:Sugar transferase n=1 Tax=Crassaminicella indica TaxID=2855394 RepID=A0ABX8RC93_9CLOT|nr:sugar transferase [Crassaminicella indica]QXM06673.1 sugar transferase [Crassaminicella indica]